MKPLSSQIASLVEQAIRDAQSDGTLPTFEIPSVEINPPKRPEQGDYATAIALQLAKPAQMNPLDIAAHISKRLPEKDYIATIEVAPPGFINFRLNEDWLRQQVETIIAEGDDLFKLELGAGKRAQVEFVSANPTGPLHVGRSRGAIVGDSMARILEAAGYDVEREYYFNNAGQQMINLGNSLRIRYLEALGKPVNVPSEDDKSFYQGEYLIDFAKDLIAEKGDSLVDEDWQPFKEYAEQRMFEWIKRTLARVNIHHDVFFNEDSLYTSGAVWDVLKALDERGYIYKAKEWEGASEEEKAKAERRKPATYFRSSKLGDDKDRVVVKADDSPTYTLPDIAYHVNKIERGFDVLVNVLGADHGTEYKVVAYGVNALGYDASKIHVIIVQMVRLLRKGQVIKMSTRAGDYDTLDDLIDEINQTNESNLIDPGTDVVRYLLLARSPDSHLDFDLDLAVTQSNENPVYYIQNAHVRCVGIFRQAEENNLNDEGADLSLLGDDELRFLRKALELGEQIEFAATTFAPHKIAFYAHELANTFHPIYENVRVLHSDVSEDAAKARLRFYRAAQITFKRVLALMGMRAPDKM